MVNSSTTDTGKAAVQFGKPREEPGIMLLKEVFGKGDKAKDTQAKVERIGSMEFPPQGGSQDGGGTWQAVSSNPWTSKLFLLEDKPPGLELKNSFGALVETDLEEEIPMISYDDFPLMSCGFECEKKDCAQTWQVQRKDTETKEGSTEKIQTRAKDSVHWRTRATSTHPGGR